MGALRKVWAVMDAPAGKRMAPFLPEITAALERAGEFDLPPAVRAQLVGMSAATIDRRLAPDRAKLTTRAGRGPSPGRWPSPRSRSRLGRGGGSTAPGSWRSTWSATTAATRAGLLPNPYGD
jgi:hypothetical protein